MAEQGSLDWETVVSSVLEATEISEDDFKKKGASSPHAKVLAALQEEWCNKRQPVMEERAFQIDFVGRTFPRHGQIELAVEVDTWFKATGNWVKLLDINAGHKVWIYLCREKEKAAVHFEDALREFRKLARLRREEKEDNNNVALYMKVAGVKKLEKHYLFE